MVYTGSELKAMRIRESETPLPSARPEATKRCPFCAEKI
jgi:hypothetical protein